MEWQLPAQLFFYKYISSNVYFRHQSSFFRHSLEKNWPFFQGRHNKSCIKKVVGSKNVFHKSCQKFYILGGEFSLEPILVLPDPASWQPPLQRTPRRLYTLSIRAGDGINEVLAVVYGQVLVPLVLEPRVAAPAVTHDHSSRFDIIHEYLFFMLKYR